SPGGDALEIVFYRNATSQPETIYLAIEHFAGNQEMIPQDDTTPLEFRLVFFESNPSTQIQGIANGSSAFGGPTMYGHAVAPGVVSVGAVPWFDTPMFNPGFEATGVTDPESFSSRGGDISVLFDATGAFAPRTSFEPDMAAVDGNNTTFFGYTLSLSGAFGEPDAFPNFFGTSAAAPNAAAVAALMRQLNGLLTPAEITAAFVNTAVDITGFRAAPGRDDVTGAGLIDANAAIGSVLQGPNGVIHTPAGHVTIDQGGAVMFTGTGISHDGHVPLSFFWDFGGSAPNSTLEDPGSVTFNPAGVFTVRFIVTDSQGTSDPTPATVTVTVLAPAQTRSGGGGSGGGCTLHPDAAGDVTLAAALGCILAYLGQKGRRSNWRTQRGSV
ncbi:MAG TPA: S8 family serine peptidase, partial [Candidatus Entotheonella sp.]